MNDLPVLYNRATGEYYDFNIIVENTNINTTVTITIIVVFFFDIIIHLTHIITKTFLKYYTKWYKFENLYKKYL